MYHRSKTLIDEKPGPGSYLGKYGNSSLQNFKVLGRVGKETRFTNKNPLYKSNISPGPAKYDIMSYKSVSTEASTQQAKPGHRKAISESMNSNSMMYSTFGSKA